MGSDLLVVAGWGRGALTPLFELSLCKAPTASERALSREKKQREVAMGVSLNGHKCRWGLWCRTSGVSAPISNARDGGPLFLGCAQDLASRSLFCPLPASPLWKPRMPFLDGVLPPCFHHTHSQGFPCTEICEEPSA